MSVSYHTRRPFSREAFFMKMYSTKEFAELAGVSIRTLKRWRKSGKLEPVGKGAKGDKFYTAEQLAGVTKYSTTGVTTSEFVTGDKLESVKKVVTQKIVTSEISGVQNKECKVQECKNNVTVEVGSSTNKVSVQERITMAEGFLNSLILPVANKFSYLWIQSEDKKVKRTIAFSTNDNFEHIAQQAIELNDEGNNVFVGVNLTDKPMSEHERPHEEVITLQTAIIADIDCQSAWHVGEKYPATFEQAKNFLPFEPSILVNSGAGLHSYLLLKNPLQLTSEEERQQAISRNKNYIEMIRQNAGNFAGAVDGVHDLPRILRLPGTYNLKHGRENAPLCKIVSNGKAYTIEELRELIKPNVIIPAENSLLKPSTDDTPIYHTKADSKIFADSPEYDSARALAMIDCINVSQLDRDNDWLAFISACKNLNIDYAIVDAKNAQDSARYNERENRLRWDSVNDPSFDIETLHGLAKRFGYVEKDFYREYHKENKKNELKKSFHSDSDVEKILAWQKHNGEISPDVLSYLKDAKTYLENLKVEDITAGIILSSQTKYATANCFFYDFYSDCATNFVTRMKSAISAAKAKVKSATAENPTTDDIKSLSSIRPSDFDKSVSVIITETKNKHKNFLLKMNIEKANQRREQYEQAPSTTRTNCPDCPVDLILPYQTSFEKNRGIFASDDKGRPKCITRTPLIPTKQFVNPAEGTHHYEIAINTHGDHWQKVIYDAESLFNAKNVMSLVNDGARFSSKTAADISEWLATILSIPENQELIQRVDIYNQPGWTDDTCTEFIYPQNEEKYLVRTKNFDYEKAFAKRGDKSEWLKMFEKVLSKSMVTRLTLGAVFSAPLINVLNIRNLQLHLSCPSGNGKTALVKFATSAYGNPEKFKFKFNGTSNSFETQSTLFNDLPSWLEELQSANKKQRESIDQIIYDYESGIGRGRNTKNNFLQKQKYFRGMRISTGEQNLTNQFSGEGAISRILEITRADIFDNDFAIEVHKFCAENFGHFGQDWINFIVEHKAEIRKSFNDLEKDYRKYGLMSNHVTTFAACHIALAFFCTMLEIDVDTIEENLISDFHDFVSSGELPSKDRATNASRALQTVAETVASHPKFFKAEKYDSTEDDLKLGTSEDGSAMYDYGFILKNGDVAIYHSALREILKDYPSVDALIRNFAECGYLDCGTNEKRPYQKQTKYNGSPRWVYRFKKSALEK